MLDAVFNSAQELTEGYVVWLICTVILCLILLKFCYKTMLEIHNDDTDYSDEFDDEEEDAKNTDCDQTPEKAEEVVEERQVPEISAENPPAAETIADSESSRELTIVEQLDNAEITEELTPQQQKVDKVLTFLTVTFCFFVISGLVMKIFLYLIGLIFLFFGVALSSIGAIALAIIFFLLLAFVI